MKYDKFYHADHEFADGDYLWHFMTYDRNGDAFCIDITRMQGIVFGVGYYDPNHTFGAEMISLADKAVQQFVALRNAPHK